MNLLKIRKYLIRQQFSDPRLENPDEHIERFKKMSFKDILADLDMTRSTYLNALRTSVKGKYTVFHQRSSTCLNINNYNPSLLLLNRANMDLTWISGIKTLIIINVYNSFVDTYAIVAYILGYLTKVIDGYVSEM